MTDGPPPDPADVPALAAVLASWRAARRAVDRVLAGVAAAPRCAVWGAGLHTELVYQTTAFFRAHPEREWILVDGDPLKHGRSWRGLPIQPPAVLAATDLGDAPLVVSSYGSQDEIAAAAVALGVPPGRVVRLYDALHVY